MFTILRNGYLFFNSQIKNGTKISDDLGDLLHLFPVIFIRKPFVMTAAKDEYLVDAWQLGIVAFFMLTGVGSVGFKVQSDVVIE